MRTVQIRSFQLEDVGCEETNCRRERKKILIGLDYRSSMIEDNRVCLPVRVMTCDLLVVEEGVDLMTLLIRRTLAGRYNGEDLYQAVFFIAP